MENGNICNTRVHTIYKSMILCHVLLNKELVNIFQKTEKLIKTTEKTEKYNASLFHNPKKESL